jgi:hypothetical protein
MSAWHGNWRERIKTRLHAQGYQRLSEYLRERPAVPYVEIADLLGKSDVAAFQVAWLHYEEAVKGGNLRQAAMDSLARDVIYHLPEGWKHDSKGDFHTAGVYSNWLNRIEDYAGGIEPVGDAVWQALVTLGPPAGWKPNGPDDQYIVQAFEKGWPTDLHLETMTPAR